MRSSRTQLLFAMCALLVPIAACVTSAAPTPKHAAPPPAPRVDASQMVRVRTPVANGLANSPLHVTGEAHGSWYTDESFTLVLYDYAGRELTRGYAQAQGGPTTDAFVPFEADLDFAPGDAQRGTLVFEKAGKGSSAAGADALRVPVRLPGSPSAMHPVSRAKRAP